MIGFVKRNEHSTLAMRLIFDLMKCSIWRPYSFKKLTRPTSSSWVNRDKSSGNGSAIILQTSPKAGK
ncbi:Uncharacterized protein HZ326_27610 [Fusarium oxysporum f. sp. albedinis]|nr:Uncharacterized protein HZ326_27610 [Fusarium oxysporum f. sp. albedinis]